MTSQDLVIVEPVIEHILKHLAPSGKSIRVI
jgi:hypothetical protein